MVSLFTRIVARGVIVPIQDKRLASHVENRVPVNPDIGPAATATGSTEVIAPTQASVTPIDPNASTAPSGTI